MSVLEAVRGWLSSVIVVSLLLSAVRSLTPTGAVRNAASFTGGLVLAAALLRPFALDRPSLPEWGMDELNGEIQARQEELLRQGEASLEREVLSRTESLIEQKAASLGLDVRVRVSVQTRNGVPVPWRAELSGTQSAALERWLASELDIPPERQIWDGDG